MMACARKASPWPAHDVEFDAGESAKFILLHKPRVGLAQFGSALEPHNVNTTHPRHLAAWLRRRST